MRPLLPTCQRTPGGGRGSRAVPRQAFAVALVLCLGGVGLGGCGAVTASSTLSDAQRDLAEAKAQEADEYAPYEFTRADAFFKKAKELNGMGQYQIASSYARASQEAAAKSLVTAQTNKEQAALRKKFAPPADQAGPAAGDGGKTAGEQGAAGEKGDGKRDSQRRAP